MPQPRTTVVGIAVGLVVLAGCKSSNAAPSETTTTATTTVAPTTTTPPTTAATTTSTTTTTTTTTTITTTVAPTTTKPPAPTSSTIAIPPGVPTEAEIIKIINAWNKRLNALYAAPDIGGIDELCVPDSACSAEYTAQISDLIERQGRVEGRDPATVAYLRSVTTAGEGGFTVSYWTGPLDGGLLVSPAETIEVTPVPEGLGDTLTFVPNPGNSEFPWRVSDETSDPT